MAGVWISTSQTKGESRSRLCPGCFEKANRIYGSENSVKEEENPISNSHSQAQSFVRGGDSFVHVSGGSAQKHGKEKATSICHQTPRDSSGTGSALIVVHKQKIGELKKRRHYDSGLRGKAPGF